MAPKQPDSLLCPDWVFSNNSNVHTAKDRAWFTEYTPFETKLGDIYGMRSGSVPVVGIGTVEILTKRSPNSTGRGSQGTLRLTDVLHTPTSICNIIGRPILRDYNIVTHFKKSGHSKGSIEDENGKNVAYFDARHSLFRVRLLGPPVGPRVGPSAFKKEVIYMINAYWSDVEREKWESHQTCVTNSVKPGYTAEEKAWLKENYSGEFRFLQTHGLSIYKDEDREEGRLIVRGLMMDDEEEDDPEGSDSESDFEGHMADYNFTEAELDFIKDGWKNSMNFMYSYGLKFYDDEDCEDAKQLIKGLMETPSIL